MKKVIYCIVLQLFFSCVETNRERSQGNYYFDLKDYFEHEANRLQHENPIVHKTVMLNRQTERQAVHISDWHTQLAVFMEANINKSAYAGKYQVDTLFYNQRIMKITYTASDRTLKTRLITLEFDSLQMVNKIEVLVESHNTLYHTTQQLRYHKNKIFSVAGWQKIRWLQPDTFRVDVIFDNNPL